MKKIVLTGGGTAGHVTPHLALLPLIQKEDFKPYYIGTKKGMERDLIARVKIPYFSISAGKLRRYADVKNFTDLFRIFLGFVQAIFILLKIKPHVVFSKGGFVACPVVWAASLLRIPVVIHESDITPGLANRLCLPFARKVCCSFEESVKYLPASKVVHTGLPIRESLLSGDPVKGRKLCGFEESKPTLLIICGSLGSKIINDTIISALDNVLEKFSVCHISGKSNETFPEKRGYKRFEYVNEELADLFAMTDLVISRAGATTLFELLAMGKPNLLIPLGSNASRGDQILNAESFQKKGFSFVLPQDKLTQDTFMESLFQAFENRHKMIENMKKYPFQNGTLAVWETVKKISA